MFTVPKPAVSGTNQFRFACGSRPSFWVMVLGCESGASFQEPLAMSNVAVAIKI